MSSLNWRAWLGLGLGLLGATQAWAAPANDNFASAVTISGTNATVTGSNVASTAQVGEPNNYGVSGGHTVWWKWTAPSSGLVVIDTAGSGYDTTLGVYTGSAYNALSFIADNDDAAYSPSGTRTSYVSFTATAGTTYRILVDGYSANTGAITLHLKLYNSPVAPTIVTPPVPTLASAGTSAVLSVVAEGTPSPFYQWRKDGFLLFDDGRINGANGSVLIIVDVGAWDAGEYTVEAVNPAGTVTSDPVTLWVLTAPQITSPPVSLVRDAGESASFTVAAEGLPSPNFQWQRNGVDVTDDGRVVGAKTATLTITNLGADDVGTYTVYAWNSEGTASSSATLTVNLPPSISAPPVSLVRTAGQGASFSVTATGTPVLEYQWRKNGVLLPNGGNVSGATTATLNLTNVQAGDAASYTVAITNAIGATVSAPATLSLNANDLFAGATLLSGNTANGSGSNTTAAAEIGEPSHAGNTTSRSVWWRWTAPATGLVTISTAGSTFDTVLGVYTGLTMGALTLVAANDDSGGSTSAVTFAVTKDTVYQIAVDGYQGATGAIALAINLTPAPDITAISPPRQVVNLGQNLTLTATVTGTGPLTYQWKRNGRAIAGATSTSYTITGAASARDNGWYQLVATNAGGTTTSATVFVNVAVNPGELIFWGDSSYGMNSPPGGITSFVDVAAGGFHGAILKGDGTVTAWGFPYNNVAVAPPSVTSAATANVVAIAAGNLHTLALKADGTVVAWGYNTSGESAVPAELAAAATARVVSLSAGTSHSLALRADGTVVAWGSNSNGQSTVPASLANPATANVIAIAAGGYHSLALRADGTVVAWGLNTSGQGTVPGGLTGVAAIAAGSEHSVALKSDGTVVAWGLNTSGQSSVPNGLTGVEGIAAKHNHTIAFKAGTGAVAAWGSNSYGASTPPAGLDKVVGITAGFQFGFALRNAAAGNFATLPVITQQPQNQSVAAGDYANFQVTATAYPSPTYQWRKGGAPILGATGAGFYFLVAPGDAGTYDVVVTTAAGSVTSNAVTLTVPAPVAPQITAQPPARNVVTRGDDLTLSVTVTGAPSPQYVWKHNGKTIDGGWYPNLTISGAEPVRDNGWYQVEVSNPAGTVTSQVFFVNVAVEYPQVVDAGDNEFGQRTVPADVGLLMAVEAGGYHTLGLRTNGTVVAWGAGKTNTGSWPQYGQSIVPAALADPATAKVVAIAGGGYFSAALREDGTVVAWGHNANGQASVPPDLADPATAHVVAISAGNSHLVALRADGTVRAWGDNYYGQATVPSDLADPATAHVIAISAGRYHNLAQQDDGTVRGWGYNAYGQANPPYFYNPISGIAAGGLFSAVVDAYGYVDSWNTYYFPEISVPYDTSGIALVAAGGDHVVALRNDGTVRAWGDNSYAQAVMPDEVTGVFAISAGEINTVMLRDGAVPWASVTLNFPPGANLGDAATFDPLVQNLTGFGIKYQWFRNGSPVSQPSIDKDFVWSPVTMSDIDVPFTLKVTSYGSPDQEFGPFYITVNGVFTLYGPSDQTVNAGDAVTFEAEIDGYPETDPVIHWEKDGVTIPGANTTTLNLAHAQASDAGTYVIVATTPYQQEVRDATLTINKTQASVSVESQVFTYDGNPKSVGTTTIPGNLSRLVTYNGSDTLPTDVGVWSVHATITDASYYGQGDGTLTIVPANALVNVPDQVVSYDGTPKVATVNAVPGAHAPTITYNGSLTPPTGPGHYEVIATITSGNYTGTDSGSLDIVRATPVVTWANPANIVYGTPLSALQLNATANAPGTFNYVEGEGSILTVGSHQLTVNFKPSDIVGYTPGVGHATINVTAIPTTFALNQTSFTYNGSEQGPTIVPTPGGADFTPGGTTSATNVGNYTATATATGNYGGSNNALNWSIAKATQVAPVISSGSSFTFGTAYSATANSGFGALEWALGSGSTASGVAINSGTGAVSATTAGTAVIKVRFAGDANHLASPYSADFPVTINKASQVAPLISSANSFAFGAGYTATANSGFGALEWALGAGSTAAGAAINASSGAVTSTGVGSVVIKVRFAGDAAHTASAYSVDFPITVNKASQSAPTISSANTFVFASAYTATANSGFGALEWALGTGSTAAGAAINASSGAVTSTGVGTVVIKVRFAGDATHLASAYTADFTVTVTKQGQVAPAISSANTFVLGSPYTATANSGFGALEWALGTGSTAAGAAINASSGAVTSTGVGTVVIKARFAGDATHNASAYTADFTVTVTKQSQVAPVISSANSFVFGNAYTAAANSGFGALEWTLGAGSTAAGAAINASSGAVTSTGVGTVVIKARFAGDATHLASAYTADFSITVNKASQSVPAISSANNVAFGSAYTATANSGFGALEWALGAGSTAAGAAINASSGAVTSTGVGTVVIKVRFAGDATHNASAYTADFTITVNKASQVAPAISSANAFVLGNSYTATANGGFGALEWALGTGSTASGAAINASSGAVTATGYGTVVIKVRFAGDATHNASAYSADFSVAVTKQNQPAPVISSGASFVFGASYTATANTGFGALEWTLGTGSTAAGAAINATNGAVTATSGGTVVIKARFAGDSGHEPSAYTTDFTVTVLKVSQVAPVISSGNSFTIGSAYTATANGGFGALEWALGTGSSAAGAAINASSGAVTVTGAGTVVIKARFAGDGTHNASAYTADFTITVNKLTQLPPAIVGATSFPFGGSYTATANPGGFGALEWTLDVGSTAAGAAINATSGAVTSTGVGTVVIKARFAGDATHSASGYSPVFTVTVTKASQPAPVISSPSSFAYGASYTATANTGFGAVVWSLEPVMTTAPGAAIDAASGAVTSTGFGIVAIRAQFAGDATHSASPASAAFPITVLNQSFDVMPSTFNWQGYLLANPDVASVIGNTAAAAWSHFINYGIFEGRTDGDFSVQAYLAQYLDLAAQFGTDLRSAAMHWYTIGRQTGLRIPKGFDVNGYLARNLDIAALFSNDKYGAWLHYYNYGLFEGRSFDANFIPAEYLELNTDLKAAFGSNWQAAVMHWFNYGHPIEDRMGRVPIGFNVDSYLARYPDLGAVFGSITPTAYRNVVVWHHYLAYGTIEGRSDGDFEAYHYLATNPDLNAIFGTDIQAAALHWYFYGRREGRRIPGGFDVRNYRSLYPDVVLVFGDDLYGSWIHYRDNGVFEGRYYDNLFRPADYLFLNPDVAAAIGTNYRDALLHWLYYGQYEGRQAKQ